MDSNAGTRANLKKYIKVDGRWRFVPVAKQNGRPTPAVVLINGVPTHSKQGTFYLEWRQDGERKQQPVGRSPREALNAWNVKTGLLRDSDGASLELSVGVANKVIATAGETFLRR